MYRCLAPCLYGKPYVQGLFEWCKLSEEIIRSLGLGNHLKNEPQLIQTNKKHLRDVGVWVRTLAGD
jgi:hypothetical protein